MPIGMATKADAPAKSSKAPGVDQMSGDRVAIKAPKAAKLKPAGGRELRTVEFPPPTTPWAPPAEATVLTDEKSVYDGDTCKIPGYSIRLNGVNAPERRPAELGWEEAQKAFEKLVKGKPVDLTYNKADPRDDYGRLVANIAQNGKDVATQLVTKGVVHAYFVDDDPTIDREAILKAQATAKKKGLGLWAETRFKKPFTLTSFHANGRGADDQNPNVEYLRICNIKDTPIDIGGYTVNNAHGKSFTLPSVLVPPGQTVQIFSGEGANELSPPKAIRIHLNSQTPIWDNFDDKLQLKDAKGKVVLERLQNQDPPNLEKFATMDVITQAQINKLGSDVKVVYSGPSRIDITDYIMDDGDTIFIPRPKDGTFKVTIADKYTLDLQLSGNDETPDGKIGIRFMGVDTPETKVVKKLDTGEMVFASQGLPGTSAKESLKKMLEGPGKKWVDLPAPPKSPFDFYDRLLGTVHAGDVETNATLIAKGDGEMYMSWEPGFNVKRFEELSAKSKAAFEGKLGIYSDGPRHLGERPSDFRRRMANRPPSRDYVIDMATKLVYPHTHVEDVKPFNRVYILANQLDLALRDKTMGLKMAPVSDEEPSMAALLPGASTASPAVSAAEAGAEAATGKKPRRKAARKPRKVAANAVRGMALRTSEAARKKKA